jgi:hypothetical protein
MLPSLTPIPEFPGFELPWGEHLHPPLLPPVRRPVTKTRPFLGLGFDDARHIPAPVLARRLADHIDEFRLVGHGSLSSRNTSPSLGRSVCSQQLNDLLREWLEVEGRAADWPRGPKKPASAEPNAYLRLRFLRASNAFAIIAENAVERSIANLPWASSMNARPMSSGKKPLFII